MVGICYAGDPGSEGMIKRRPNPAGPNYAWHPYLSAVEYILH